MSDYELKFQKDLERAQELSLESLALEQFRKQRRTSTASPTSETECDGPIRPSRSRSGSGTLPPALPPPPRRPARRSRPLPGNSSGARSTSASPTNCDMENEVNDLISFTSPSSKGKQHQELKEYIDSLHRGQADQLALVHVPKANIPKYFNNSNTVCYPNQPANVIPYPTSQVINNNAPNPLFNFPNTPYINRQFTSTNGINNYETQNKLYPNLSGLGNYNTTSSLGFNQNNVTYIPHQNYNTTSPMYPQLGNFSPQTMQHPQNVNTFPKNDPANQNTLTPNPSSYPQLNMFNTGSQVSAANNDRMKMSPSAQSLSSSGWSNINQNDDMFNSPNASRTGVDDKSRNSESNLSLNISVSSSEVKSLNRSMRASSETSRSRKSTSQDSFLSPGGSSNLIDLGGNLNSPSIGSVRVSVLEAFDPLMADQNASEYMCSSECSSSVYEEYDPLDFLYGGSETQKDTPIYSTINRRNGELPSPLPSPPPKTFPPPSASQIKKRTNTVSSKLYECVSFIKKRQFEPDLVAFLDMVKDIRCAYIYSDTETNPGYVVASKSQGKYPAGTSIKLLVYHDKEANPITFTCDVESTVEHVILHVVCELEGEINEDISVYTLRVWGMSEYLTPGSALSEYDYVRRCVRLEKDIMLCLQSTRDTSLARLERDDTRDGLLTLEELVPNQNSAPAISYHNLSILLETLERELSRLSSTVLEAGNARTGSTAQAVKAICTLLGSVETIQISNILAALISSCSQSQPDANIMKPEIVNDTGDYCSVSLRHATIRDTIGLHCQRLREAVKSFISIYCKSNIVDFQIDDSQYSLPGESEKLMCLSSVTESALFYVEAVHRIPVNWNHDEFVVHAQIFHGTRLLKGSRSTLTFPSDTTGFYPRVVFESWINLDEISIASLPKEARLVLTLSGRTLATPDNQNASTSSEKDKAAEANQKESPEKHDDDEENSSQVHIEQEELGWTSIQLFDFNGLLISGGYILSIWPMCADKRLGPAPDPKEHPPTPHPAIHIEIPSYCAGGVYWKEDTETELYSSRHSFDALDKHTQQQLMHLIDQGPYQKMPTECREILWEKRHYLKGIPGALPLVLLASLHWDATSKRQLMHLLDQWAALSPHDALHLLLPCFPDEGVRERAVNWLWNCDLDLLTALIPQLCLGLRYEHILPSPLARLLLARAMQSPRFAHRLYWQLVHDIPGNSPQNSSEEFLGISLNGEPTMVGAELDSSLLATSRWIRRNQLILRALLAMVGENLAQRLLKQQLLVKGLTEVASSIKNCKENVRNRTLLSGMENLAPLVKSNNICLPLSISQEVHDIDVKSCSYFPSNTLPLKINFVSSDNAIVPAIFKIGDDLRQDTLVLQVIRVMDQLWLMEGLDLRMVTFEAVPTQLRKGIIEMVCSAETLRVIQVEWGLTGSFKDKPIAEWLAKHNPSELEYERAVTNFTASCAGYSVATYLLGICDRHNDNIMLKTSGHLFHIDFGKFLGDAQMFGNFKRDRTPFVLTPDMAYVINGGERPSQRFHHFVELCCTAFNIVRKHQNLILNLFSLMASSGIAGVSAASVGYVRAALLPGQTPPEAAAAFARLIHSAIKSRFTPINFFLHNLAQLRAGDQSSSSSGLLSFMPKTYTMTQEGRLTNVEVLGYEKRYDPEKYYVYTLRIYREGQATPFVLYRSYKHFTELYQKICLHFPLAKVHSLPVGLGMGRSNTKQAAERRFNDVQEFLRSLFSLADEIAHHDLVYTFFHPMLRDQQDVGPQRVKNKSEIQRNNMGDNEVGALKITIQYSAGVLSVLILHAQSLPMTPQGVPPSPYVKVYLVPDPSKETKRKTRVLKKNCHPSFMEMLEYRLPLEVIRGRNLQATVWHHDPLQENQFLGGVQLPLHSLDLTKETTQWYPLQYIPR